MIPAVPATSAPNYDGLWSVVIITNKGTCDRAYRYPIRIARGTVLNAGDTIGYVHLADSFKPARYIVNPATAAVRVHQHLDIGMGDVDWQALFGALKQIRYEGVLSVGVFAHKDRPMESFRANFDAVHQIAAGLGVELD